MRVPKYSNVSRYPIDIGTLAKGMNIHASEIERLFGVKANEGMAYRAKVMELRAYIHEETDWTVKHEGDGLRILEDEEASKYNGRQFNHKIRGMFRTHERATLVDTTELTESSQRRHERMLEMNSRILAAVATTRALPRPRPVDKLPGVVDRKKKDDDEEEE